MTPTPAKPDQATADYNTASPDDSVAEAPAAKVSLNFLGSAQGPDELGRLGHYRILKVLGQGGMGIVFLAEDTKLERQVALKVMLPKFAEDERAKQRFLREAKTAAKIEHDHIVHIYQVDEDRGVPFLAMQLLTGSSLEDVLKRSGRLSVPQILRLGAQIAEGLAVAHGKGLIHRDIKPANIWIEADYGGRVKILDFGLARTVESDVGITQSGAILGTPAYMPPEQARGEHVDHRCDLYALGCVLYRMATGELPIKGKDTMGLLMALALETPAPPKELNDAIPEGLNDLILELLAKDANKRPESARDVGEALRRLEQGLVATAGAQKQWAESGKRPRCTVDSGTLATSEPTSALPREPSNQRETPSSIGQLATITLNFGLFLLPVVLIAAITFEVMNHKPDGMNIGDKGVKVAAKVALPARKTGGLEFDGTTAMVVIPSLQILDPSKATLEAWVRPRFLGGKKNSTIVRFGTTGARTLGITYDHRLSANAYANDKLTHFTTTRALTEELCHLAVVWNGQEQRMFINGEPVPFDQREFPVGVPEKDLLPGSTVIGALSFDSHFLAGTLYELRVSKSARYLAAFTPSEKLEADLDTLGLYRFHEGQGNEVKDSSGNGHHGKIVGAKWVKSDTVVKPAPEPINYALSFFSDKTYVEVPSLALPLDAGPLTIEAYVHPEIVQQPERSNIVAFEALTGLGCGAGDWGFSVVQLLDGFQRVAAPIQARRVHLAGVRSAGEIRLYVDGKLADKRSLVAKVLRNNFTTSHPFLIGGRSLIEKQGFTGTIDEVRVSRSARYSADFAPLPRLERDDDTLALYHFDEGQGEKLIDSSGNGHHGKIVGAKWVKVP